MAWTGGCLCGAVRFEVTRLPKMGAYCYCKMCQRWRGSVVTPLAEFDPGAFRCTEAETSNYRALE